MLLAFAAGSAGLVGLTALATDGGLWYMTRRAAQNAADAAAIGGAAAIIAGGVPSTAGVNVAGRNGFAADARTSVVVRSPPTSGPSAGSSAAVEVVLNRQMTPGLSRIFFRSDVDVGARAVAVVQPATESCVLSLRGKMTLSGSSSTAGSGCVLASNSRATGSITLQGAATVSVFSMVMGGSCSGCTNNTRLTLTRPYSEYQPNLPDPYASLNNKVLPTFGASTCLNPGGSPTSLQPYETTGKAYCSDVRVNGNNILTLTPGTYYFSNASLTGQNGQIICPTCTGNAGVTLVFTGTPGTIGGPDLNGNVKISLQAPAQSADPAWNGILMYRDARAPVGYSVRVNGTSDSQIGGALYFPTSTLEFLGNMSLSNTSCVSLVADTVNFGGNASVAGCAARNTTVPRVQAIRLTE
ncbi:pilus assembly protein TadG-related protein [Sabulicella glaciei]|uniref:Pilus assembly protein TadG-related protein n=1 Tax=Sabulicella glaciei TaxID=2984948 RepID=A0ABT3NQ76_9PROT|nr:pilus assembly protein TadG-related protein [Roseococcus sp. MDT2-1-1]